MAAHLSAALAASFALAAAAPPEPAVEEPARATPSGAGGVFSLPTPTSTPEGKVQLGLGFDWWRGGALSASLGLGTFVEVFGAAALRSTNLFSEASRRTLVSAGDLDLGVKLLVPGSGPLAAGVLLQLDLPSGVGGVSFRGLGGRAAAMMGYAGRVWKVPVAVSGLLGYRLDNSARLVSGTPATFPAFALGLSTYDLVQGGATLLVPLRYLTPAVEVVVDSPVARQTALPIGQRPVRARLALGLAQLRTERVPGLSFAAAVQLSLTGAGRIDQLRLPAPGFAPDPPWSLLAGLSWTFDRPALPRRAREIEWHKEPTPPPVETRPAVVQALKQKSVLRVVVLDAKTQLPLAGAWVSFVEGSEVGGTTGPDGKVRVETDAGSLTLVVARDGYELLTEPIHLLTADEKQLTVALQPVAPDAALRGRLLAEDGAPLRAAVFVSVAGALPALPGAGGSGPEVFESSFSFPLQHGTYQLNAVAPGYRCTPIQVEVRPGETVSRDLELRRVAGEPRARAGALGIEISLPVGFVRGREQLAPASLAVLGEAAQALKGEKRALEAIARVDPGELRDEAEAMRLSDARARAAVAWLRERGVRVEITPRGAGFSRPGQPLFELRVAARKQARARLHDIPMEVSRDP
jgi:hypothetical protein